MLKRTSMKTTVGLGLASLMMLGLLSAQPALADDEHESVEAQFQSTGTIVLKKWLRGRDFMLLKDVTPLEVVGGHIAYKVPCDNDGESPLRILLGSASEDGSNLVPVDPELIEDISNFGRDCVYHADIDLEDLKLFHGDEFKITDVALANTGNRRVRFGRDLGNTVTVNPLTAQSEDDDHHEGK